MTSKKKKENTQNPDSEKIEKDIAEEKNQESEIPDPEAVESDTIGAEKENSETSAESDGEKEESADARYTRLYAEFQNYKKRTSSEGFERYLDGKKDLTEGIIDVLDNFERAILSEASSGVDPKFVEGMDMIRKQLIDVLAKNGVEEIEALGEDFDPNIHQGVGTEASDEYESGKVILVLQKGYVLKDKVIRPSMVKIAE